ncbi:MAG: DUF2867 domain-containing protein [Rubrivivax sp.]
MAPASPPEDRPEPPAAKPQSPPPVAGHIRWTEGSMLYRRNRPDSAFYAKHTRGEAVAAAPATAPWDVVSAIGGDSGYYFLDALWKLRGRLDQLAGGSGMTRGRRLLQQLAIGDAVDF